MLMFLVVLYLCLTSVNSFRISHKTLANLEFAASPNLGIILCSFNLVDLSTSRNLVCFFRNIKVHSDLFMTFTINNEQLNYRFIFVPALRLIGSLIRS